jgi:3-hydroxyacyl-CoA dehydrogenase
VFENMEIKKEVFAKLDAICKPGAVLATNTSALNVNEIATAVKRPEAVVGMHFFSPGQRDALLEVCAATRPPHPVLATAMQIGKKIGKIGGVSGVCPGFIGNRMLRARSLQAQAMLMKARCPGTSTRCCTTSAADGSVRDVRPGRPRYRLGKETSKSSTVREVLCEMDRRGQKTGAGYYDYDEAAQRQAQPVTEKIDPRLRRQGRQDSADRSPNRRSSSAACTR